jgi:acetyl-CoA carboxylase biotin carboxyl carrier protein
MGTKDAVGKPDSPARTIGEVRTLAKVLRQFELTELEVEGHGVRIRLSRKLELASHPAIVSVPQAAALTPSSGIATVTVSDPLTTITSPFVGTFYRAPGPESAPFVELGQVVSKGQTLCIVEAMKLMNEIEAEFECRIVAILVKNAEAVEYGQGLFRVEPN